MTRSSTSVSRVAVALASMVFVGLPLAAIDARQVDASTAVKHAVETTMKQRVVRSERSVSVAGRGTFIEEFIAPNRLRVFWPALPDGPSGVEEPALIWITIGKRYWVQDSRADPPRNELFVACTAQRAVHSPELFGILSLVSAGERIERVSVDRYRFRLDDKGNKALGLKRGRGKIAIRKGLVRTLSLTDPKSSHGRAEWNITYGGVDPINPPADEQISRRDCKFTQGTLPPPTITITPTS